MTEENLTPEGDTSPPDPNAPTPDRPPAPPTADPFAPASEAPAAPTAPAPWPPVSPPAAPSPAEDAEMREHRARRFGAADPDGEPAGGDGPMTQYLAPGAEAPPAEGPPPTVTPRPAAPLVTPFPPANQTGSQPAATSPFPPTTQFPVEQPAAPEHRHDAFEGLEEASLSRAAAHWWTVLITLVFAPVAWYLFTDGGARIEWASAQSQPITIAAYIEFGLGLLAVFIFLLAARWSSVGSIVIGSLVLALGVAYLAFPVEGAAILAQSTDQFGRLGQFGLNVAQHLGFTLENGLMALYGLVMIMVGVVSHGARRQGRREERTRIALGE